MTTLLQKCRRVLTFARENGEMREEKERDYILHNSEKDELINEIIKTEWDMFDDVNNIGGRAYCQDDDWTFYVMRYSQSHVLNEDTLQSYRNDLKEAKEAGRNMIMEKYAYMMEKTDPEYYRNNLKEHLPVIKDEKLFIIRTIANQMISWEVEFSRKYPRFSGAGRPLQSDSKEAVSMRSYMECELMTYSHDTLEKYLRDVNQCFREKGNMVYRIKKKTAEFYGFSSVEEAESRI